MTMDYALKDDLVLENYRIERLLGSGGFGLVYLAEDTMLIQKVVIKEYLPSDFALRDENYNVFARSRAEKEDFHWGLERFLEEARTLAKLQHPNIVKVRYFFKAYNTAYMVMDYVEGHSLEDVLYKDKTYTENEIYKLLYPLLDALEYIHKYDILHRDIKPSNIIIQQDENNNIIPILIDFGAARQVITSKTRSLTSIISAGYAPIEQYDSKSKQGSWTDIYALGAVLYRCIVGKKPAEATNRVLQSKDSMAAVKKAAKKQYSNELLSLVDHCLQIRPEQRPQNIAEVRKLLPQQVQPLKHSPFLLFAVIFLFIITGLVYFLYQDKRLFNQFQNNNTQAAYQNYLSQCFFPCRYQKQAKAAIADIELFDKAKANNSLIAYQNYLEQCSLCIKKPQAQVIVEDITLFTQAEDTSTIQAFEDYLTNCKICKYSELAHGYIKKLGGKSLFLQDHLKDQSLAPKMRLIQSGEVILADKTLAIKKDFYIGVFEVSVKEYLAFVETTKTHYPAWMEEKYNDYYKAIKPMLRDENNPITGASWYDAKAYCQWLSEQTGFIYRLASKTEWEYAARAGAVTAFWWGDSIDSDSANYNAEYAYKGGETGLYRQKIMPVNSFSSNPWGLYNVHGNVWEWTLDKSQENNKESIIIGGAWNSGPEWLDFENFETFLADYRGSHMEAIGFRIVREK